VIRALGRSGARVLLLPSLVLGCGGAPRAAPESGPSLVRLDVPPGIVVRRACVPTAPERCFDARDDNCNGIIDEGCGVNTGLVQFAIAWDEANADVDLDVTDPDGELVEVGRVTRNGLTKERDCPGRHSECRGQNLENVFLEEGEPTRGDYRVRIRLEKLSGEEPPVRVTLGARVGPKTYSFELELFKTEDEREIVFRL
jgi:tRNA (guanosine-2'-O-)-methyltransferase